MFAITQNQPLITGRSKSFAQSMTSCSTDNLGFPKAYGCLVCGKLGLGGVLLVDCGKNSVDGCEISLERAHN